LRGAALSGLRHILAGQLPEFLIRPAIFLLLLAGAAIWIKTGLSAAAAMLLYLFAAAIAFAGGAWLLWKKTPFLIRRASPVYDKSVWLASALPLALIGGMTLITQQASLLLLGFFVPDSSIGLFRIAAQVAQLASFGLLAINTVLTPRFAALHAQGDKPRLQQLVTGSARLILLINLFLTLVFLFGGKLFLHLAFGINYEGAYNPLIILLVGQLINSGTGSVGVLLNMSGHEQHVARVTVIAALLNVALNLALIPFLGINGSAVATSASLIIWNILLWWAVRKKLGLNSLAFG
jgi:O-antigen/teichoic acid export membrane protein